MARKRIKAATLIEVMVAMVILTLVFGVGIMIYVQVMNSAYGIQKVKAITLAEKTMEESLQKGQLIDIYLDEEGLQAVQEVNRLGKEGLVEVVVTVKDDTDKELYTLTEWVYEKN